MKHYLLIGLVFMISSASLQAQTLEQFIQDKNNKMQYDESRLVSVSGTNVKMIPPEYFKVDNDIKGFVHPGSACTIQVVEVPGIDFHTIENGMTTDHIQKQGYTFKEKTYFTTATGKDAVCFLVGFQSQGTEYERLMFFTGTENTIWVNINYPLELKKLLFPALIASLLSVQ